MKRDATDYAPRPKTWIAPDGPADHRVIRVRVSPAMRKTFDAAAQRAGKTLSGWMRDLATEASRAVTEIA